MVTNQVKHALHIVLVVAGLPVGAAITTSELSSRLGLSVSYLEGVLKELRSHGLVQSIRGPGGGYQIGADPQKTTVWDVVAAFPQQSPRGEVASDAVGPLDWLIQEAERVKSEFLTGSTIASLAAVHPSHQERPQHREGQFKFRPLPPPLRPRAPNSVFDLSAFYQLAPAATADCV